MDLARLQKACFAMALPISWMTPSVRNLAGETKNEQNRNFAAPVCVRTSDLIRIIAAETIDTQSAQIAFLRYLFALRGPSETMRLLRAYRDDKLTDLAHQGGKALIAIRPYLPAGLLVAKFAFRKNVRSG